MAVMYVWTAEWDNRSLGHASLSLNDNSAYISWWPTGDKSKNCMKKKKTEGRTKECVPDDYEDDRDNFTGREYTHRFYIWISAKGVENIRKWWMNIKDKGGYNLLFNNCCDAVVQALRKGGIEIKMSLFRKPGDMVGLGNDLEQDTTDEDLNEDVKRWKKIRHETLARLRALKQEIYRANAKIKETKRLRNVTTGASLFVGALLAPVTGGASWFGAAMITVGATAVTFAVETIIERDVIETTQAAVDEDKTETIQLRQRVTHFHSTEISSLGVALITVNLDTISALREQSLLGYIKSWIETDSTALLNAIAKLDMYTCNLESELHTVEKVQEKYAMP